MINDLEILESTEAERERPRREIRPQPGPQEAALRSNADIIFYGGAAGGGKTFALLLRETRWIYSEYYRSVIFRRTMPQVFNPGGLFEEAASLYIPLGAKPKQTPASYSWPQGGSIRFGHLELESDKHSWQGAQLSSIAYDEVTHFSFTQFSYLLSRWRNKGGPKGNIFCTCNPDPDSWVATMLEWWIDQDEQSPTHGLPIQERSGVKRYFVRINDEFHWAGDPYALMKEFGDDCGPQSVTFIPSRVTDNQILLERDPKYVASLKALSRVDRARLLEGNWKVKEAQGELFKAAWFPIVDQSPSNIVMRIRYWDRAATKPNPTNTDPDWTVGLLLARSGDGEFYVEHVERFRDTPLQVKKRINQIAQRDPKGTIIGIEQDPGQAGVAEKDDLTRSLAGYNVRAYPARDDKITRAKPASAQSEQGNIKVLRGAWIHTFLSELEAFPAKGAKKDQVDALSGAFNAISGKGKTLDGMTKM